MIDFIISRILWEIKIRKWKGNERIFRGDGFGLCLKMSRSLVENLEKGISSRGISKCRGSEV